MIQPLTIKQLIDKLNLVMEQFDVSDNEPKQIELLGLDLEEDSEQVAQDYLIGTAEIRQNKLKELGI